MIPAIGYAVRPHQHIVLDDSVINAAEITFDRPDAPLRVGRYLSECCFDHVSLHASKLSLAGGGEPSRKVLEDLREIAYQNNAETVSDHLGVLRTSPSRSADLWYLPPPLTSSVLTQTCRQIETVQHFFRDRRFFVESVAYLGIPDGSMTEAEFVRQVLRSTGCGWLLDLTTLHANAVNCGFDAFEFLSEVLPDADRIQLHLSGGYAEPQTGLFMKSASHPIPEAVWSLYRSTLEQADSKISAVYLERDQDGLDEDCWRGEVSRVRAMVEQPDAALV